MTQSSLRDLQTQQSAVLPPDESASPLEFGDPAAEYAAARESAALFDVADRVQIELTGDDRAKFLHNFCTNEIKALQPGNGCEAFVTNVKGRVLAHVFVFAAPQSIWLDSSPGADERLLEHLDRYLITEDVELHNRTAEYGELLASGPQSAALLQEAGIDGGGLDLLQHKAVESFEFPAFVRRVDWLGSTGYALSAKRGNLGELWSQLVDAGLRPAGSKAFDALRIEAGLPRYGCDIGDDNIAQEVSRTKQAISFTKGCYLGQEPIARLDALGHVNRELRGLRLETGDVPEPNAAVIPTDDDKEIGRITSAAVSFANGNAVALGYLKTKYTAPGTEVRITVGGEPVTAAVFWPHE